MKFDLLTNGRLACAASRRAAAELKPLMEHDVDDLILQAAAIAGQLAAIVGTQYIESHYFKTPYHTSILSGQGWVL